ncbi:uncharacterized protein LOC108035949 [Drosophila biarmipes]|uniref:uncharacterized protein LOC108035949 n=1 Tax=Drosophila biarmipes TaxID=125945 RepID=UPI0007E83D93|nr:uncharacterized protein LOC108035949 [Drosophila biarmipes]
MFKFVPFKYQLCALGSSYDVIADACRDKTKFFSFVDSRPWRSFRRNVANFLECDISTYHIYYWFVLIFSFYGLMQSLFRFSRLLFTKEVIRNALWHNNRFHVFPPKMVRRFGVLTAFILTNIWATLFYAVLFVSPRHMMPWLWVQSVIFAWRLVASFMKSLLGSMKGNRIRTTIYLTVYVLSLWLVYQCSRAFTIALKQDSLEKLMLCSRLIDPLLKYLIF